MQKVVIPEKIQRWAYMEEEGPSKHPDGLWVLYRDHAAHLAAKEAEIEELKRHAPRWQEQANSRTHWENCCLDHRDCALRKITALEAELKEWRISEKADLVNRRIDAEQNGLRMRDEGNEIIKHLEDEVRHLMWTSHGHSERYGDDGEMQCSECAKYGCWDYKNAPLSEVRKAYQRARYEAVLVQIGHELRDAEESGD